MKPEKLIQSLIDGQVSPAEFRQAAHKINGLTFWAMDVESEPGQYDVESRRNGYLLEKKQMTRPELEAFKPRCAGWSITSMHNPEFVHDSNRDQYPYEL